MLRKYFKMNAENSAKVFIDYEKYIESPKQLRNALIDELNIKWDIKLPLVVDEDASGKLFICGYQVPLSEDVTPKWAIRTEFYEGGERRVFWKPNNQTSKGKELAADLQVITDQHVTLFTDYMTMRYLNQKGGIMDEYSQLHVPVIGRLNDIILMSIPVLDESEFVKFNELGFVQIIEDEFTRLVSEAR